MNQSLVLYEFADGVATLTLNMPELRNPISDLPMVDMLVDRLQAADRDPAVRCIVLTGAGSAFSAGGNLKAMHEGKGPRGATPAQTARNYRLGIQRIPLAFAAIDVPVIAAVNGPAIGAGCDLACMCDLRIAGRSARFAESFVKLGIVPGDGGAWLLPRLVGLAKAMELALIGGTITADEALRIGLVNTVVEDSELTSAAHAAAAAIAANPPLAVRLTKRLIRQGLASDLPSLLDASATAQAVAHETEDHAEAVAAFLDKRTPTFVGR